jgi:glycolate oxidase iron-sulfur subunit
MVEHEVPRSPWQRALRAALRRVVTNTALFGLFLDAGRIVRPFLPAFLARKIPQWRNAGEWPSPRHARRMIVLDGCVQPAIAPSINAATARILDRIGIAVTWAPQVACCGAVEQHMNEHAMALARVRSNVDAWWPLVQSGAEAIVITASGCGTMVAEYGHLLRDDPLYADKAARISALAKDVSEVIAAERAVIGKLLANQPARKVAFHSPCSLQHGLKIKGVVESILRDAGFTLTAVPDGHLCCGSAGTYSILQPKLSSALRANKVAALESGQPDLIATANIGCLAQIAGGTGTPVRHWIELLEERLPN